jgi:SAM-dependent methyltransferase
MERLTDKDFWERNYQAQPAAPEAEAPAPPSGWSPGRWLKRFLGTSLMDHSNYLLWEVMLTELLPHDANLKVVEVGSAPGAHLLLLHEKFGYAPYGIEYTETGATINRQLFAQHGLDPTQVIQADVFSPAVVEQYAGYFDVVVSFGFIEHFDDVTLVLQRHLALLKEGGWLVVQIPCLSGFNYWMARLFNHSTLALHNRRIMQKDAFRQLFSGLPVQPSICDYVGVIKLQLCLPQVTRGWRGALVNAAKNLQMAFNVVLRRLFPRRGGTSSWFSPYLVFIGKKVTPHS